MPGVGGRGCLQGRAEMKRLLWRNAFVGREPEKVKERRVKETRGEGRGPTTTTGRTGHRRFNSLPSEQPRQRPSPQILAQHSSAQPIPADTAVHRFVALNLRISIASPTSPNKCLLVYAFSSTPCGSTLQPNPHQSLTSDRERRKTHLFRTSRKSPKRGYSASSCVRETLCDFAQCGRPPCARRLDSNAAKRALYGTARLNGLYPHQLPSCEAEREETHRYWIAPM